MTPAQAYGHPTLNDVPVQGPTDPGIRDADCRFTQTVLPVARPACVDCEGPIPMWARTSGVGEQISYGRFGALGFALGADGDVWTTLSNEQQKWVTEMLAKLDSYIKSSTGSSCPTWSPSITGAGGCFKQWFNANYGGKLTDASGKPVMLTPTTVFDQPTLDALITVVGIHGFQPPYPAGASSSSEKKLSTGKIIGISAVALGTAGLIYAVTSKKKKSSRRR